MNPKKLDHFLKIVEAGSLSRAADLLDVSQPVLSREVRELEEELGVRLLHRFARGVGLTPAGEALRQRAEQILGMLAGLREEVNLAADQPAGQVTFGIPASMTDALAAPLVKAYVQQYPAVRLHVREGTSSELRAAMLQRELDLAVLTAPVSEPQLIVRPFLQEGFVAVGAPGSPIAGRGTVTLDEMVRYKLILPRPPNSIRMLMEAAFERQGLVPDIALETNDAALMKQFVAHGIGHAIMPACTVSRAAASGGELAYAAVNELSLTRVLAVPAGVAVSHATQKLMQALCMHTRELVEAGLLTGQYVGPADPGPAIAFAA